MYTYGIIDLYNPMIHGIHPKLNGHYFVQYTYTPKEIMNETYNDFIYNMKNFYNNYYYKLKEWNEPRTYSKIIKKDPTLKFIKIYTNNHVKCAVDKTYYIRLLQRRIRSKLKRHKLN